MYGNSSFTCRNLYIGEIKMSNKIKSVESQMVIDRVHELMAEGKASKIRGWVMSNIVNTIDEEMGPAQSVIAAQYILGNYGE